MLKWPLEGGTLIATPSILGQCHGREVVTQLVVIQPLLGLQLFLLSFSFTHFPISTPTAIHNWHGDVRFGLALDVGDSVDIVEECKHWYRGSCPRKSRAVGLFPKTYIHIKDLSKIDPVVAECTQVLREWSEIWKRLYVVSGYNFHYLLYLINYS